MEKKIEPSNLVTIITSLYTSTGSGNLRKEIQALANFNLIFLVMWLEDETCRSGKKDDAKLLHTCRMTILFKLKHIIQVQ